MNTFLSFRRPNTKPRHAWSQIWSGIFGIIGFVSFILSFSTYHRALVRRATMEPSDPDVVLSIVRLMTKISLAEGLIGVACLVGSVIYLFISRRQKYDAHAA